MPTVNGEWPPPRTVAAADVTYDNAASGLAATDVQAALDELAARTSKSMMFWGGDAVTSNAANNYLPPGGGFQGGPPLAPLHPVVAPCAFTVTSIQAIHAAAAGNGNNVRYTLLVNLAPTALVVTVPTGAAGPAVGTDAVVNVAKGDRLDILVEKPDGPIGSGFVFPAVTCCLEGM